MNQLITTLIGEIPESDLEITESQMDQGDVWVTARECKYKGIYYPNEVGNVVRRDVWVTMKQGQASKIVSEL
jgi:hypothetical protein